MRHAHTLRHLTARAAILAASVLAVPPAHAAEWQPDRPVTLIVPSTAGAGADITGRLFSHHLSAALGQPVVVENRGGAGGLAGTTAAARSTADGYTLLLGSDYAFTIYPQLRTPPYDPVKDFTPVGLVANLPMVLVVNPEAVAATDVTSLLALAKADPGKYSIASAGVGSSHHLAAELLQHQTGVDLLHVPYRGAAEALTDVLGGRANMMFISPVTALPHLKSGKLKALGVSVKERIAVLPDVPTLAEAGVPDFNIGIWFGFLYPANTPQAAVDRVNAELQTMLAREDVRQQIRDLGYTPAGGDSQVLATRIQQDAQRFGKLIKDAGIVLQ